MINSELRIRNINWSDRFNELDVDQAVDSFTNCLMFTCCDRDAPWITDEVKKAVQSNHRVYKPSDWTRVKQI